MDRQSRHLQSRHHLLGDCISQSAIRGGKLTFLFSILYSSSTSSQRIGEMILIHSMIGAERCTSHPHCAHAKGAPRSASRLSSSIPSRSSLSFSLFFFFLFVFSIMFVFDLLMSSLPRYCYFSFIIKRCLEKL